MAKINKQGLVEFIYEQDNFETKKQAAEFLDDFLGLIKDTIIAGDEVTIAGFGKFSKFTSPVTNVSKPKFAAFSSFKAAVN